MNMKTIMASFEIFRLANRRDLEYEIPLIKGISYSLGVGVVACLACRRFGFESLEAQNVEQP